MFKGGVWVCKASIAQRIAPKEGFEGFVAISCGAMPFSCCALRGLITDGSKTNCHPSF